MRRKRPRNVCNVPLVRRFARPKIDALIHYSSYLFPVYSLESVYVDRLPVRKQVDHAADWAGLGEAVVSAEEVGAFFEAVIFEAGNFVVVHTDLGTCERC